MPPRARPYRDFLTPSLHGRASSAFISTLFLCYVVSLAMGSWDGFLKSWFPIGPAGIRTLMLFISTLSIYILRVAQMHIGERTTTASVETFLKYTLRRETLQTFALYSMSAFWFGEVYIWSQGKTAKLGWTDPGKPYERIRLNERPIYVRTMFMFLAVSQAGRHLYYDYDRVKFPIKKVEQDGKKTTTSMRSTIRVDLAQRSGQMAQRSISMALVVTMFGSLIYFFFFRRTLWQWNFYFAKSFHSLAKTARPGGLRGADLFGRFLVEASYLVFIWEFTNASFDAHMAQEPLKKEKPITDDSKDPNGSLLNGLKSKNEVVKNVAFWELALISASFPLRRKSIYEDTERDDISNKKKAPFYKQIVAVCLGEIKTIVTRIQAVQNPSKDSETIQQSQQLVHLVPRISQPLKDERIARQLEPPRTNTKLVENFAASYARNFGSPGSSPAKRLPDAAVKTVDTNLKKGYHSMSTLLKKYFSLLVESPFGVPFRKTYRRVLNVVVNGSPYSQGSTIADATNSLTKLAVKSLKEDTLGLFHKEVPGIIRAFVVAIKEIETFVQNADVPWTDVDERAKAKEDQKKGSEEIEAILDVLKGGLGKIIPAFSEYLDNMGMSRAEIREAKGFAKMEKPEMAIKNAG